jgi:hypothetical protein
MHCSGTFRSEPSRWHPSQVPAVDDVRPARCPVCGHVARLGGQVFLHGHGWRGRTVVVLPAGAEGCAEVGECWVRRFRCTVCRGVRSVLPRGVLPRFLYSVGAIVSAFFLTAERPVGDALSDFAAYERQGMYRRVPGSSGEGFRWRSVGRWERLSGQWWPGRATRHLEGLLVSFLERAGRADRSAVLGGAVASHVAWGGAM